jgi:hypothetical protein
METQYITLVTKAQNGKITVRAEIPVPDGADTYLVTIGITPQPSAETPTHTLDALYGALADTPLPEITEDPYPETRDTV